MEQGFSKRFMATSIVALTVLFTSCQRAETPAATAPAPAEKAATSTPEPPACTDCIPVNADNFVRAETDLYFGAVGKKDGFGRFEHDRTALPIDEQTVIRTNRDTLYSGAVFDLDAGPVTITLPDPKTSAGAQ